MFQIAIQIDFGYNCNDKMHMPLTTIGLAKKSFTPKTNPKFIIILLLVTPNISFDRSLRVHITDIFGDLLHFQSSIHSSKEHLHNLSFTYSCNL